MHFLDKKSDDAEKWKGHSYGCALMNNAQGTAFGLIMRMIAHGLRRYWRILWMCFILSGLFCVFFIVFQSSEPPNEIRKESHVAKRQNVFYQSMNEQMAVPQFHPKQLKTEKPTKPVNPAIVPKEQSKHPRSEKRIDSKKKVEFIKPGFKSVPARDHDMTLNKVLDRKSDSFHKKLDNEIPLERRQSLRKKSTQKSIARDIKKPIVGNGIIPKQLSSTLAITQHHTKTTTEVELQKKNERQPNYYDDNLRPDWTFNISRQYDKKLLRQWTEPIQRNASDSSAPGENGTAFVASKDEQELMQKLKDEENYNVLASNRISMNRTLPDFRTPECRSLIYPTKLPTVSVVIVFHNEIWPTLFRTVWSIINRSPPELVEEIILVDDASTFDVLKQPLDDYIKTLPAKVRVIRIAKREGLIRARLAGARVAKGSVLTFFDAHMECSHGWLPPMLARIASDRSVVVVPLIDAIVSGDLSYMPIETVEVSVLRWSLIFRWMAVPQRELKRTHNDKTAPIRIPTHVGCAFSIDREFFFEIGSYDEGMDIWGSENVELAFRVWLCGGALEVLPCSHVGHLYRVSTYSFNGNPETIKLRNNNRLVEVWMDDYKEFYYAANPQSRKYSPGNLTERFNLKKRLQCKNFQWYLDNIYPESNWRREYYMMGQLKSVAQNGCLDIFTTNVGGKLIPYGCHGAGGNQFFAFAKSGQIITTEDLCVGINNEKIVILVRCSDGDESQLWDFYKNRGWILHRESSLCMQNNHNDVIVGACNTKDIRTKWEFKSTWRQHVPEAEKLTLAKMNSIRKQDDS